MYINVETGEYPLSVVDIQNLHPSTMMAHYLDCYAEVQLTGTPEYDTMTQGIKEGNPKLIDNVWLQDWVVFNLTQDEIDYNLSESIRIDNESKRISITRRQALLALFKLEGIKDSDIEDIINSIEDADVRYEARINWIGANTFEIDSEFVKMISNLLNISPERLEDLFKYAESL